jgi:hypothetical protein
VSDEERFRKAGEMMGQGIALFKGAIQMVSLVSTENLNPENVPHDVIQSHILTARQLQDAFLSAADRMAREGK